MAPSLRRGRSNSKMATEPPESLALDQKANRQLPNPYLFARACHHEYVLLRPEHKGPPYHPTSKLAGTPAKPSRRWGTRLWLCWLMRWWFLFWSAVYCRWGCLREGDICVEVEQVFERVGELIAFGQVLVGADVR